MVQPLSPKVVFVFFRRLSSVVRRPSSVGFTLFEIMVALAIVGMMMGIVVASMGSSPDRNLKKTSKRLASTIRYLYNKSAMEGIYIRLVLDLEERSYWVEATSDPVAVEREDDQKNKDERKKPQTKKDETRTEEETATEEASAEAPKEGEILKLKPPEPEFSPEDSFLLRPTKLPNNVFFKDVQVEHRNSAVEGGKESIYFFPNGYVEKAVINLRDEKDEIHYSLTTNPVSGRVDIENEYKRMGEE